MQRQTLKHLRSLENEINNAKREMEDFRKNMVKGGGIALVSGQEKSKMKSFQAFAEMILGQTFII